MNSTEIPVSDKCPSCSAPVKPGAKFCTSCGTPLADAKCPSCGAPLTPAAKFCQQCGAGIGSAGDTRAQQNNPLPWVVSALAILALIAMLAGRGFSAKRGSTVDAPQNALPQAGLDDRGAGMGEGGGMPRGPDISQMSPQEMANRLFNRIMTLSAQGKQDSVAFFAPMAIQAYQNLPTRSIQDRYSLGLIALTAGAVPLAKAQADTILKEHPGDSLGTSLAAQVEKMSK